MLGIKSKGNRPVVKLKNDICPCGRGNYVEKIFSFAILNKWHFVVTRSAGLVQLYEKQKSHCSSTAYKLVKEWKNSTVSSRDPVVAVGSFRNQYMYTCSNEGKLVIRDLINDDADDSVKTYLIDGPISSVQVLPLKEGMRILVAAGGQDNDLKMYDLDFTVSAATNFNRIYSFGMLRPNWSSMIRLTNASPDGRRMRARTTTHYSSTYFECMRLLPVFVASYDGEDSQSLVCGNWILSIAFANNNSDIVCCGTQFGDLMIYQYSDPRDKEEPQKTIHLSQFPINTLHVFGQGRYLLYTDAMSKIGVIDIHSYEIVNFYDFLKIGPTVTCKVYTCSDSSSKFPKSTALSKFKPIYVVATTIDGNMVIYKLHDSNESELKLCISHAGIIPDLDIIDIDAYNVLESVFGEMNDVLGAPSKRRKRDMGVAQFLQCGSSHLGPEMSEAKGFPSIDDMKLLNRLGLPNC